MTTNLIALIKQLIILIKLVNKLLRLLIRLLETIIRMGRFHFIILSLIISWLGYVLHVTVRCLVE